MKVVANNLLRLRKANSLSQIELARKAKLSLPYVCLIENGRVKNITIKTLQRITDTLSVDLIELFK